LRVVEQNRVGPRRKSGASQDRGECKKRERAELRALGESAEGAENRRGVERALAGGGLEERRVKPGEQSRLKAQGAASRGTGQSRADRRNHAGSRTRGGKSRIWGRAGQSRAERSRSAGGGRDSCGSGGAERRFRAALPGGVGRWAAMRWGASRGALQARGCWRRAREGCGSSVITQGLERAARRRQGRALRPATAGLYWTGASVAGGGRGVLSQGLEGAAGDGGLCCRRGSRAQRATAGASVAGGDSRGVVAGALSQGCCRRGCGKGADVSRRGRRQNGKWGGRAAGLGAWGRGAGAGAGGARAGGGAGAGAAARAGAVRGARAQKSRAEAGRARCGGAQCAAVRSVRRWQCAAGSDRSGAAAVSGGWRAWGPWGERARCAVRRGEQELRQRGGRGARAESEARARRARAGAPG
jgi:hypothetical protein